ncbi:MAG: ATP-binding protein [Cyclobacteriaceae bacterium]
MARLDGSFVKQINQPEKVKFLVFDDFWPGPARSKHPSGFIANTRRPLCIKSVVKASQLPIAKWHEYIEEPTLANAIMDRLFANVHRFELKEPPGLFSTLYLRELLSTT